MSSSQTRLSTTIVVVFATTLLSTVFSSILVDMLRGSMCTANSNSNTNNNGALGGGDDKYASNCPDRLRAVCQTFVGMTEDDVAKVAHNAIALDNIGLLHGVMSCSKLAPASVVAAAIVTGPEHH